jgi:hypothetical protein
MKYLIFLLLPTIFGCSYRTYTNEECVQAVAKALNFSSYDRQDQAFAEVGASMECAKNNNDPDKTLKNLSK